MLIPFIDTAPGEFSDDGSYGVTGLFPMGKGGSTDGKMQVDPISWRCDPWEQTKTLAQMPHFTDGM